MSVVIKSGSSTDTAIVDTNNNLKVNLPTVKTQAGYSSFVSETDAGTYTGTKLIRSPKISPEGRLRVGSDRPMFQACFSGAAPSTNIWTAPVTTWAAVTVATNELILNSGLSTAVGNARAATWRHFPFYTTYNARFEAWAAYIGAAIQNDNVVELGMFQCTLSVAPTDGVLFRWNATGNLVCVVVNNSTETVSSPITGITINEYHSFKILLEQEEVEFWIDNILVASIPAGVTSTGAINNMHVPIAFRNYNSGITALPVQLRIAKVHLSGGDIGELTTASIVALSSGLGSFQNPPTGTTGSSANYANSAAPASATLSNTTAGYATMGGQFQFVAVAGAETDYALFAYLVPAASNIITGYAFYLTGIRINTYNSVVAVATTATVMQWSVGVGSTAISLATSESVTARARRVIPVGIQTFPVGATVGAVAEPIGVTFSTPLTVEQGQYLHIILKMPIGTATATEIFRGVVGVNGYFE